MMDLLPRWWLIIEQIEMWQLHMRCVEVKEQCPPPPKKKKKQQLMFTLPPFTFKKEFCLQK